MSKTRIYKCWQSMVSRCNNKKDSAYYRYGALGITVDDSWLDFPTFYRDMGDTYSDDKTLDRVDNTKGYSKANCRWANIIEQANNRKNNTLVTLNGRTQTLAQWAREYGLRYDTLTSRMSRGLNPEDALLYKSKRERDEAKGIRVKVEPTESKKKQWAREKNWRERNKDKLREYYKKYNLLRKAKAQVC